MDSSITLKHLRCCGMIGRFFGRELNYPGLTNFKAFLIGITSLRLCAHLIQNGGCCWIPSSLLNGLWCFSLVSVTMEGVGILYRCFQLYASYFTICPFDPYGPYNPYVHSPPLPSDS